MGMKIVMRGGEPREMDDSEVGSVSSLETRQKDSNKTMGTKVGQKAFNKMLSAAVRMFAMKSFETLAHPPRTWKQYLDDGDIEGIIDMETGELMDALLNEKNDFDIFNEMSHSCAAMMLKYGNFTGDNQSQHAVVEDDYGRDDDTQMLMRQYADNVRSKSQRRIGYGTNRGASGATV